MTTRKLKKMALGGILAGVKKGEGAQNRLVNEHLQDFDTTTGKYNNPDAVKLDRVYMNISHPWRLFNKENRLSNGAFIDKMERGRAQDIHNQYRAQYDTSGQGAIKTSNPLMADGGQVPGSETVELEKGEPFMGPDGQIDSIPQNAPSHAEGGVAITLPSGTKVLGKKPATSEKTFKELGTKLEKQQDKYNKILDNKPTRLAEATAKLMLEKVNKEFNNLFTLQGEDVPEEPATFEEGGTISAGSTYNKSGYSLTPEQRLQAGEGTVVSSQALRDPSSGDIIGYEQYQKGVEGPQYDWTSSNLQDTINSDKYSREVDTFSKEKVYAEGGMIRKGGDGLSTYGEVDNTKGYSYFSENPEDLRLFQDQYGLSNDNVYGANTAKAFDTYGEEFQSNQYAPTPRGFTSRESADTLQGNYLQQPSAGVDDPSGGKGPRGVSWGNALNTLGTISPMLYNAYKGAQSPNTVNSTAFSNPYEQQIRSNMAGRRYNIEPELEAARLAEATYARNLREGAPSASQYLGGLQAGAVAGQRNVGNILARKQNADNAYLGEQAGMDAQLGAADSQRQRYIEDINQRAVAAKDAFAAKGFSQLNQYSQAKQIMNNQIMRDAQLLGILPDLVQHYDFKGGKWYLKGTQEEVTASEVQSYVKGGKQ